MSHDELAAQIVIKAMETGVLHFSSGDSPEDTAKKINDLYTAVYRNIRKEYQQR